MTCAHVLSAQELSAILDEIRSLVAKEMCIPQLVGSGYWRLLLWLLANCYGYVCFFVCKYSQTTSPVVAKSGKSTTQMRNGESSPSRQVRPLH